MELGIPLETSDGKLIERRVGLTPGGVKALTSKGAIIYVESQAGLNAGFSDEEYISAGAKIVYSKEDVYQRSELIIKVSRPTLDEMKYFRDEQTILCFFHAAIAPSELRKTIREKKITVVGYEIIEEPENVRPILRPMSEIAGKLSVQIAGRLLEGTESGRKGVLLGGIYGIPPAEVVIIGVGTLGYWCARSFSSIGASVYVLDENIQRLERIEREIPGKVVTMLSNPLNIEKTVRFADVLIGAVLQPGKKAPLIITKKMVSSMRKGSVIMDFTIDHGGCVETIRPTPDESFAYYVDGVLHFGMPNVPSKVPRTSSYALTNSLLKYLLLINEQKVYHAISASPGLKRGVYYYRGELTYPGIEMEHETARNIDDIYKDELVSGLKL